MGKRGQKQGKGDGDGDADGGQVDGHPQHSDKGRSRKGGRGSGKGDGSKGSGKPDNAGYQYNNPRNEYGWKGSGKDGYNRGAADNYHMPQNGRGGGRGSGGQNGGKGDSSRPIHLELPKHEEVSVSPRPTVWPITPLGLPRTPPPLPPVPAGSMSAFLLPPLDAAVVEDGACPSFASDAAAEGGFTPVAERQAKMDRRTFFHTEGRNLAFNPTASDFRKPVNLSGRVELGEKVVLKVEEVHFGNPRVRIRQSEPAPMPEMLKWPHDRFDEHTLECAEIDFGEYRVWSAVGIASNRLLYAMKRQNVARLNTVVVAPPVAEAEDDVDLTYGASCQAIQLVP